MRIGIDYTAAVRQQAGIGRYAREPDPRSVTPGPAKPLHAAQRRARCRAPNPGPRTFGQRELPLTDRHLSILWQKLRVPLPVEWLTGRLDIFHSPDFVLPPVRHARTVLTIHDLSFLRHPGMLVAGAAALSAWTPCRAPWRVPT